MDHLYSTLVATHQQWLFAQGLHEARSARLLLVTDAVMAQALLARLGQLPLALVSVAALTSADHGPISQHIRELTSTYPIQLLSRPFAASGLGLLLSRYHAAALITQRPYPALADALNQASLRAATPWTALSLWGAQITLGPTILPDHTACYACYQARLRACETRHDVWQARDSFLRQQQQALFQRSISALTQLAASYGLAEIERLLLGQQPPLALGREVQWDSFNLGVSRNHVEPFENCPACGGQQNTTWIGRDRLAQVVANLSLQAREVAL